MNNQYLFQNSNKGTPTCRLWLYYFLFKSSLLGSTQSSDMSAIYPPRVRWNKLWEEFHILVVWNNLVLAQNALGLFSFKWVLHILYWLQYNLTWLTHFLTSFLYFSVHNAHITTIWIFIKIRDINFLVGFWNCLFWKWHQ